MYSKLPNLVFGFHGCTKETHDKVLHYHEHLNRSTNIYDWLGNGIYFWQNDYGRALEWAPRYEEPAVIGAVIDLGYCLNLTDYKNNLLLKKGYELLKADCELNNLELPKNHCRKNEDVFLRDLDCAVIQKIHSFNKENNLAEFDSVLGIFSEGDSAFPGSSFKEKTHIQMCIVNPNCIKAYFEPMEAFKEFCIP